MGLAASQARLLFLTARKCNVESDLMNVANEKLSLSRQTADASQEYSDAMNAVKLTWATEDYGDVDLDYSLLMRPNTIADVGQYLITNPANSKIMLDSEYKSSLNLADVGNPGDLSSQYTQSEFLQKLIGCPATKADEYVEQLGNGNSRKVGFTTCYNEDDIVIDAGLQAVYANNAIRLTETTKDKPDANTAVNNFVTNLGTVSTALNEALSAAITQALGNTRTDEIAAAMDYAYDATMTKYVCGTTDNTLSDDIYIAQQNGGSANNKNYMDWIYENKEKSSFWHKATGGLFGSSDEWKEGSVYMDGSQLIDTYLTYFDQFCADNFGGECLSTITETTTTRAETGGTGTQTYDPTSEVGVGDMDVNNNNVNDLYEAQFYLNMYDALNSVGWQVDSKMSDSAYVQSQILYGDIAIKELQDDGTWSDLSTSDYDCPLGKESDTEAIAKAEAEYNAKKALITSKETKLELKSNDLDTERTAITAEEESVQSILKENIKSSFKIFEA